MVQLRSSNDVILSRADGEGSQDARILVLMSAGEDTRATRFAQFHDLRILRPFAVCAAQGDVST